MQFYGYLKCAIIVCAVMLLVGAEPTISSEPNPAQANAAAEAAPLAGDVAVTVNGVDIPRTNWKS